MKNFKDLLLENEEAKKETKLGHLSHLHRLANIWPKGEDTEEERSYGGHRGIATTDEILNKLHDFLRGKSVPNKYTFSEKMEGAPSFLARKYDGKTSVAYKGAAGKPDQMLSSHEEIDKAYGHAPGLADKMHKLLDHVGKILPDSQKIYQGDFMGDEEGIQQEGEYKTAQQNSMKYHFPSDTNLGKIMVSLHTMYDRGGAKPIDRKTRASFIQHPDVHNMDPTINVNPANYTPEEQAAFAHHMNQANEAYKRIKPEDEEFLRRHGDDLEMFMNRSVREGIDPSHENYVAHLNERSAKRVAGLKSEKGRAAESLKHSDRIRDAVENKKVFENAMKLSMAHQAAGDVLRKVAAKNTKHMTSVNGEATEGEGLVASRGNSDGTTTMAKITNPEFTSFNLRVGGNIAKAKEAAKLNKEQTNLTDYLIELYSGSSKFKPTHHSFRRSVRIQPRRGREQIPMNTTVTGARNQHQQYAARTRNKVAVREEAESGDHAVIVGGFSPPTKGHESVFNQAAAGGHSSVNIFTTESSRRPIPAADKVSYIKKVSPRANVAVTKTPFHALAQLHASGKRGSVTFYGGSDREGIVKQLRDYNGKKGPHGYYKFDSIDFKQVGSERSEGASGLAGISGTRARASKSPEELKKFIPAALHPHAAKIFKQLKESDTSTTRGLGYVTGDPAASTDQLATYHDNNNQTTSDINQTISNQIKTNQPNLVGFKEYEPKLNKNTMKAFLYWDTDENGDPLNRARRKNGK